MDILLILVITTVTIALIFDYTNGFHDASNMVAAVATLEGLLEPPGQHSEPVAVAFAFVVDTFKRREVYRHMSNATDRLAHAGEVLHDIVVKIC